MFSSKFFQIWLQKRINWVYLSRKPMFNLPSPGGPYKVGCKDIEWKGDKDNTNLIRIYYPGVEPTNEIKSNWLPYPARKYLKGYLGAGNLNQILRSILGFTINLLIRPKIEAYDNPALMKNKFPAILFSHGLYGCRTTYSSFCTGIASYGFIVLAIEHGDNSACYRHTIREPQEVEYEFDKSKSELEERMKQIEFRIREIDDTYKLVEALSKGELEKLNIVEERMSNPYQNRNKNPIGLDGFIGKIDLENTILAGHSFGAATSLEILSKDKERYKCGLILDCWTFPIDISKSLVPIISINSQGFTDWSSNYAKLQTIIQNTVLSHLVTVNYSQHMDQSDISLLLEWFIKLVIKDPNNRPKLFMKLNIQCCLSFLQKNLNGYLLDIESNNILEDGSDGLTIYK